MPRVWNFAPKLRLTIDLRNKYIISLFWAILEQQLLDKIALVSFPAEWKKAHRMS